MVKNTDNGRIKAAMIEGWFTQFEKRVINEMEDLKAEILVIHEKLNMLEMNGCKRLSLLDNKFKEHNDYHDKSEHRWGLLKYFSMKPSMLFLLGFIVCLILISVIGISEIWQIIKSNYLR